MVSASWLKKAELFKVLEELELEALVSHSTVASCREGETIFAEGEEALHLYVLIEGAVNLGVKTLEKVELTASQIVEEGGVFGMPSLLEPRVYNVTAKCLKPCKILVIDSVYLRKRMEEVPRIGMAIMKKLALLYFSRLNDLRKGIFNFLQAYPPKRS